MAENLDVFEQRMNVLEGRLFGDSEKDVDYPRGAEEIASTLSKLNSQVDSAIAGRPKIEAVMKRLGELERFLDPAYTDRLTLTNDTKLEIILAEEEELKKQVELLTQVRDLSSVLSSEHLKVSEDSETKLKELCQLTVEQQDKTGELGEQTKQLLQQYNNVINVISKQFVHWDELLTKLEAVKQHKSSD